MRSEAPYTAAGGHPFQDFNSFQFTHIITDIGGGTFGPLSAEDLKDAYVTLPPGLIGNPAAAPRCLSGIAVTSPEGDTCPPGSRVGAAYVGVGGTFFNLGINNGAGVPIYNVVPDYGYARSILLQSDRRAQRAEGAPAPAHRLLRRLGWRGGRRPAPASTASPGASTASPGEHRLRLLAKPPSSPIRVDCSDADPTLEARGRLLAEHG